MAVISLPKRIYERLREAAEEEGVSVEGYLLSLIAESLDPRSRAEIYWEASLELLKQAKEELSKGNLRQAGERMWGAAALAVKATAYRRDGIKLSSHRELWEYVGKLAVERGDEELTRLWRSISSMHVNFYEGWATKEHVEGALKDARSFVGKLKGVAAGR